MLGNRNAQHSFAQVPSVNVPRSSFDRSHTVKDTMNFDYLNPIFVDEVLPGDTHNLTLNMFARLTPTALKAPVMDNMMIDYSFWFVPSRLVMDNWEKLNGAQENPGDSTDYICPQMSFPAGGPEVGSIFDKFGLPTDVTNAYTIKNTLMFRAYNLIWNTWFRDENLQDSVTVPKDDGPDVPADFVLLKRGKRHDYFTSALPFLQKGPAVELPLGTRAPISGIGFQAGLNVAAGTNNNRDASGSVMNYTWSVNADAAQVPIRATGSGTGSFPDVYADLTNATAATINALREAFQMQSLFELDARGGTRYVEILLAHFNVVSPDFRLQRPEYLGGGQTRINSNVVAQTSATSGSNPLGQVAAFATSSTQGSSSIGFTKSFVEHGYVIGLAAARADLTYQQGVPKMFNRSTRFDFFWPKLQELGEQAILNKEIFVQGTSADDQIFGYQERYGEYREKRSEIRGEFRSTYATSLDYYHMAEEFSALPVLNDEFIESSTPVERAKAVTTGPDLLVDMWFRLYSARPMVVRPTPASLGRF